MSAALSISSGGMTQLNRRITTGVERKFTSARALIADAVREVAADTAVALAQRTFPSSQAIGYAARSVRRDVSSVYCTPGKVFAYLDRKDPMLARRFWALLKSGDLSAAARIVRESGTAVASIRIGGRLDPALHERARDSRGRVALPAPLQMCSKDEIAAYTKTVIATIGKTASGWSAAADDLGATVPTRWKSVAIHGRSGGHTRAAISPKSITITLVNTRPLARKHLSPGQARTIRTAAADHLTRAIANRIKS